MNEHTEISAFPDPGELPVVDWISKDVIDVDPAYQRPEDAARAEKIAHAFSWSKFGAVVVVPSKEAEGRYSIIDGQHRAAAAKMHPAVTLLPAVIMPAVKGTAAEATSFIGLNAERKQVNGLELFHAKRAAGDEDVQTVDQVLARAGIAVPRYPSAKYEPRQTIAVGVIQAMIGRRGAMRAREFLEILAKAELAPITGNQVKAIELVMTDDEFAGWIEPDELTSTIASLGEAAETEAKRFAATHCVPAWKGLANVWFQKARKRRTQVKPAAPAPARPKALPSPLPGLVRTSTVQRVSSMPGRTVIPHRIASEKNVTASVMGDPPAGRSALDQRKAAR